MQSNSGVDDSVGNLDKLEKADLLDYFFDELNRSVKLGAITKKEAKISEEKYQNLSKEELINVYQEWLDREHESEYRREELQREKLNGGRNGWIGGSIFGLIVALGLGYHLWHIRDLSSVTAILMGCIFIPLGIMLFYGEGEYKWLKKLLWIAVALILVWELIKFIPTGGSGSPSVRDLFQSFWDKYLWEPGIGKDGWYIDSSEYPQ